MTDKPQTTNEWRGLGKVIEECGEVLQLAGKIVHFPNGDHPDGNGDLRERIQDEIGDLLGALDYFSEANTLNADAIMRRCRQKKAKFKEWGLTWQKR